MTTTGIALTLRGNEIDRYVAEVSRYPLLSREEEQELARRFRDEGDVTVAHQLVVSNLRFVVKIAHQYRGYGLKLLDLIQEGNIGLMHAVKKFDPERGYRLISYAVWWIRAQIQSYIMRSWSLVKLGSGRIRRKLFFKLRSERSRLLNDGNKDGDVLRDELAARLGLRVEDISEMEVRMAGRDFSLDAPLGAGDESSMTHLDVLGDDDSPTPEALVSAREEQFLLGEVLHRGREDLNDRETVVLEKRILADNPQTLAEIGAEFGVTRERARQIEERLLAKLRKAAVETRLIEAPVG